MAQREKLFDVSYHTDDDTWMYEIGELDFGLNSTLFDYMKRYGKEPVIEFIENVLIPRIKDLDIEKLTS